MASSQTSSLSLKKKASIIDGQIFARSIVMERVYLESDDFDGMALVVSRIKQQGLYRLGSMHLELSDECIIEEFYRDAFIKFFSLKRGGDVSDIDVTICGVEICMNREPLENIFRLPSDGLWMEEFETFGSKELLKVYWGLFTGDGLYNTSTNIPFTDTKTVSVVISTNTL
ncbi:hypothetical protein OROMI_007026 [Orobanche minor]